MQRSEWIKLILVFAAQVPVKANNDISSNFKHLTPIDNRNSICEGNSEIMEVVKYKDFTITVSEAEKHTCASLEIEKNGKILFHAEEIGSHFYLGSEDSTQDSIFSLTPENKTHLVFRKWTGGMHCCYSLHIFELGDELKNIAHIDGGNHEPSLLDLDQDGIPEIKVLDDFLAYIFSSYAFSPTADVILKYENGRFKVHAQHMRKSPNLEWLESQLKVWREEIRERSNPDWPPPEFVQAFTELIFTGNWETAMNLVDRVWPSEVDGKDQFLLQYQQELKNSEYYLEFERQL